jgi:hypothetical protein
MARTAGRSTIVMLGSLSPRAVDRSTLPPVWHVGRQIGRFVGLDEAARPDGFAGGLGKRRRFPGN